MQLELASIEIINFKSIDHIEIPVKKYGNSYTTVLVGLNGAGKSNILDAINFFNKNALSKSKLHFKDICCNLNNNKEYSEILYYYNLSDDIKKDIFIKLDIIGSFVEKIKNIRFCKNIYLHKDDAELTIEDFFYCLNTSFAEYAYLKMPENSLQKYRIIDASNLKKEGFEEYEYLDRESFSKIIKETFFKDGIDYVYDISIWRATNLFQQSIDLKNIALNKNSLIEIENIFSFCGYDIETVLKAPSTSLYNIKQNISKKLTKYFNDVWKEHKIDISIDIDSSTKIMNFYIKDKDNNEGDCFSKIDSRSQGLKQFLSLILTLSIRNKTEQCKNQIILIDEPETHLHPSGIRYMRDEILKIGENNFVFVATHSPFFIDQKNMERHFIVKKEDDGMTSITPFSKDTKSFDDEVLRQAFGINILSDFLPPNKILVEGLSDCMLIQKALSILDNNFCYGITNGQGGNIKQVASILKYYNVPCLVLVDDDKDGRKYKNEIKELGSPFTDNNVLTLHDLCGEIPQNSTIEDCLDKGFITNIVNSVVGKTNAQFSFVPDDQKPIMVSIKEQIMQAGMKPDADKLIEEIKTEISTQFNPNPSSLETKNPLLKKLANGIITHLKQER